jgi:hypothetical protein
MQPAESTIDVKSTSTTTSSTSLPSPSIPFGPTSSPSELVYDGGSPKTCRTSNLSASASSSALENAEIALRLCAWRDNGGEDFTSNLVVQAPSASNQKVTSKDEKLGPLARNSSIVFQDEIVNIHRDEESEEESDSLPQQPFLSRRGITWHGEVTEDDSLSVSPECVSIEVPSIDGTQVNIVASARSEPSTPLHDRVLSNMPTGLIHFREHRNSLQLLHDRMCRRRRKATVCFQAGGRDQMMENPLVVNHHEIRASGGETESSDEDD